MSAEPLAPAGVSAAATALAAAFLDYPLTAAFAPDPARRPAACAAFCRMLVRYSVRLGTAYATPDRAAVACWLPPGREWFSTVGFLRAGALGMLWQIGVWNLPSFFRVTDVIEAERKRLQPGRHWYLNLLGVRPDRKGQGLSRVVLTPVFEIADRDGLPCFLETQDPANVGIYRRFGFETLAETELPGRMTNFAMRREPR